MELLLRRGNREEVQVGVLHGGRAVRWRSHFFVEGGVRCAGWQEKVDSCRGLSNGKVVASGVDCAEYYEIVGDQWWFCFGRIKNKETCLESPNNAEDLCSADVPTGEAGALLVSNAAAAADGTHARKRVQAELVSKAATHAVAAQKAATHATEAAARAVGKVAQVAEAAQVSKATRVHSYPIITARTAAKKAQRAKAEAKATKLKATQVHSYPIMAARMAAKAQHAKAEAKATKLESTEQDEDEEEDKEEGGEWLKQGGHYGEVGEEFRKTSSTEAAQQEVDDAWQHRGKKHAGGGLPEKPPTQQQQQQQQQSGKEEPWSISKNSKHHHPAKAEATELIQLIPGVRQVVVG